MAASLVTVEQFRQWSGAATATVADQVIQQCLDEAESGLLADIPATLDEINPPAPGTVTTWPPTPWMPSDGCIDCGTVEVTASPVSALSLSVGEVMRRASRLLARRNSPEGVSGYGDVVIGISSRDPDSARTIQSIRALLLTPEGIA